MRDRLIELIRNIFHTDFSGTDEEGYEQFADYLLENGVIVSPLKRGDKIYQIFGNKIVKVEVLEIDIEFRDFGGQEYRHSYNYDAFTNDDFGKTVFLTKEEAEAKLKEYTDETK